MISISIVNFSGATGTLKWFLNFFNTIDTIKLVKNNENPDILFCSLFGDINIIKNISAKCKIFFTGENLILRPPYNNEQLLLETFDLLLGFKYTNLSKKTLRFPLWLAYYPFYCTKTDNNIIDYIEKQHLLNKNHTTQNSAVIIARHDMGGQRIQIIKEIEKYISVLAPGRFYNNTKLIGSTTIDKINYLKQYNYNICPENSEGEGYCTEKIFQALESGTIPIYWGSSYPEVDIINENKYCFCDIKNPEKMSKSIKDAIENPDKYLEGNIFKENSKEIIQQYYDDLIKYIKDNV